MTRDNVEEPNTEKTNVDLCIEVLMASERPLTPKEILARVEAIQPVTTKNPLNTIRGAVSSCHLVTRVSPGTYWWKPAVYAGARLRHTLSRRELLEGRISYSSEVREALWPSFFAAAKRCNREPVNVTLGDGTRSQFHLQMTPFDGWGTEIDSHLKSWLDAVGAKAGDGLVIDITAPGKPHTIRHVSQGGDESRRIARNAALITRCNELAIQTRPLYGVWEFAERLLSEGFYHHPVAPDPLELAWGPEQWPEGVAVFGHPADENPVRRNPASLPFADPSAVFSYDQSSRAGRSAVMNDLAELLFGASNRPKPSRSYRKPNAPSYLFRVTPSWDPEVQRDIRLAGDHSLHDLHLMIQRSMGWRNDHPYSFFLSGEPWDKSTEFGDPGLVVFGASDRPPSAAKTAIRDLGLKPNQRFLYLFDYGEEHCFHVEVLAVEFRTQGPPKLPRVTRKVGPNPTQYQE